MHETHEAREQVDQKAGETREHVGYKARSAESRRGTRHVMHERILDTRVREAQKHVECEAGRVREHVKHESQETQEARNLVYSDKVHF